MYEERTYREWVGSRAFVRTRVALGESDLLILAENDVRVSANGLLCEARRDIESYIESDPSFRTVLSPYDVRPDAPLIVQRMAEAANIFGVGPMAAVAGAVADYIGEQLSGDVVIENGGDIFVRSGRPLTFGLFAGDDSPFTRNVRFSVFSHGAPLGVCTSSGTVGHSLSFGKADAVCVVSHNAAYADAAATSLCNMVKEVSDIEKILEHARSFKEIRGVIAAMKDKIGLCGEIELVK